MTWRELRTFVRHLPRESAYARSVHGDLVDWGVGEHLLAARINDARLFQSGKRQIPDSQKVLPPAEKPAAYTRPRPAKAGGLKELNAMFDGR